MRSLTGNSVLKTNLWSKAIEKLRMCGLGTWYQARYQAIRPQINIMKNNNAQKIYLNKIFTHSSLYIFVVKKVFTYMRKFLSLGTFTFTYSGTSRLLVWIRRWWRHSPEKTSLTKKEKSKKRSQQSLIITLGKMFEKYSNNNVTV